MNTDFWKVLIADDELIIREGIRDSVDWSSLRMEVVAEAEDGEEALELALDHSIDILLVDLNMPIMNGMTLIKHIRKQLINCKIIIITGHDEFKYAQEALRLSVTDYILKPVDPNSLKTVLEDVRKEIETNVKQEQYLEIASNQISKNHKLLREGFCRDWIEGHLSDIEIKKQLEFLDLPISSPKLLTVIQCPDYYANKPIMNEKDKQVFMFSIETIISEELKPYIHLLFRDDADFFIIILWDCVLEETMEKIKNSVMDHLKITINVAIETLDDCMNALEAGYKLCKQSVHKESNVSPVVKRAKQYIETHFTEATISLELVAKDLQVSPVYLSRMVKQELGMSFVSLVTNLRMKRAIQLLNTTELPIVEIAEQIGYDTQHYFSTAFKKVIGVSPVKYRKNSMLVEDISTE